MIYDIGYLFYWLVITVLIGGYMGWRHETSGPQAPWFEGWVRVALIALGVGFALALVGLLGGRLGFWLESTVLFGVAYGLGGLAGGALRRQLAA